MYRLAKGKAFLIAVKALITNSKDELLLLKVHTGLRDSEKWDLPGGLMEFEDTVKSRVKQEVFEETGLTLDNWKLANVSETIFENFKFEEDDVRDVRVVVIGFTTKLEDEDIQINLSEEHEDYIWCDRKQLKEYILSKPTKAIIGEEPT
ncbi:NUDIX hydrolase [Candidatus Dojkabacteria bacterium]|nr:NUDIX hydrolase [Candidatus Dojkabacteria bacterium]